MDNSLIDEKKKKDKKPAYEGRGEKFFFNMNVFEGEFDALNKDEEEDIPPPPTFSEDELEHAKREAFEEGKTQGLKESAESRDQVVASLIDQLSSDLHKLFQQELAREKRFEQEAVHLSLKIFEKMFPVYREQHGFEELKHAMIDVIQKEENINSIQIEAHPDFCKDIQDHIENALAHSHRNCGFEVHAAQGFNPTQFRLSWKDGGAIHDMDSLADQICDILLKTSGLPAEQPALSDVDIPTPEPVTSGEESIATEDLQDDPPSISEEEQSIENQQIGDSDHE